MFVTLFTLWSLLMPTVFYFITWCFIMNISGFEAYRQCVWLLPCNQKYYVWYSEWQWTVIWRNLELHVPQQCGLIFHLWPKPCLLFKGNEQECGISSFRLCCTFVAYKILVIQYCVSVFCYMPVCRRVWLAALVTFSSKPIRSRAKDYNVL